MRGLALGGALVRRSRTDGADCHSGDGSVYTWGFAGDYATGFFDQERFFHTPRCIHVPGRPFQVTCGFFSTHAVSKILPHGVSQLLSWGRVPSWSSNATDFPSERVAVDTKEDRECSAGSPPSHSFIDASAPVRFIRYGEPRPERGLPNVLSGISGWEHMLAATGWIPHRLESWVDVSGRFGPQVSF